MFTAIVAVIAFAAGWFLGRSKYAATVESDAEAVAKDVKDKL